MAFLLARKLREQLQLNKSRLTDDSFNPTNLENFALPPGVQLPSDWLAFTEETADEFIDQMTVEAEKRSTGARAVAAAAEALKADNQLIKQMNKLVQLAATNETEREKLFAEYELLQHQLEVTRARAVIDLAAGTEKENIGFAGYQRSIREGLRKITNLSSGGTHQGALSLPGGAPAQSPVKLVS
ncbi:MAG: hypothetical protein AB8B99_18905 [Phormidesmis sp.]